MVRKVVLVLSRTGGPFAQATIRPFRGMVSSLEIEPHARDTWRSGR